MADEDDRAAEWAATGAAAQAAKTIADGVPVEVLEGKTPPVEVTGRHRLTPAQFASGVELAERDGYARGFERGKRAGNAEAQADIVMELTKRREDDIETLHALWVIFDIQNPPWSEAEPWLRRRFTPL